MSNPETIHCSFCGRLENQVSRLVAGPGVYICNDCVEVTVQILSAAGAGAQPSPAFRVASRRPDGSVERSAHGPVPGGAPTEQNRMRWLRQCAACGTWNVGATVTSCLDCGGAL